MKNQVTVFKNGNTRSVIEHAKNIRTQLGIRASAGYLRNKGFSVEATIYILTGR